MAKPRQGDSGTMDEPKPGKKKSGKKPMGK